MLITEEGIIFEKATFLTEVVPHSVKKERLAFYPARDRNVIDGEIASGNFVLAATGNAQVAVPVFKPDHVDVLVLTPASGAVKRYLRLHGSKSIALRMVGKKLLCADDLGRVLMLDLKTGVVLRDLRV